MSETSLPTRGLAATLTAAQRRAVAELLRVSPVADELGRRFAAAGHELHLVGGSVRDALLGRLGDDLDFATDAHPDETLRLLKGWAEATWETGREFGTIGAQRDGLRLEITTFRAEAYDGVSRNPVVRVRHDPASTTCAGATSRSTRWRSAVPGHEFTDPFGGLADLAARVLRTPGHAGGVVRRRPAADAAGRPVRRAAALRGRARRCVAAMTAMAADLDRITAERIRDEFTKLLLRRRPGHRAAAAGRHRAGRPVPAGAARAASWRSTSTPSTRTSTSTR